MVHSFDHTQTLHVPFVKRARKNTPARQLCARAALETLEPRTLLSTVTLTVINMADSGAGSLRAAVIAANNTNSADDITINLASLSGILALTSGQLELTARSGTTTLTGPGANSLSINPNNTSRVFQVDSGVTATFSGLIIAGGTAPPNSGGGGIHNAGNLTITNCLISSNTADFGGGIYNNAGTLTLTNSTLIANSASTNSGGGLYNNGPAASATILNSTLSDNTADDGGGGILNSSGTLTLINSTVAQNKGGTGFGGAIYSVGGNLTLSNSTFVYNSAGVGGGIVTSSTTTLNNSIVTLNNSPEDGNTPSDIDGPVTGSHNLIGTGGSGGLINGTNGNLVGDANPLLGQLQDNGGPTQTISPQNGSVAVGAGSIDLIPNGITTDQTGSPRTFHGTVDIGAVQFVSSNQKFVAALYRDLLNRDVDATGLQFWAGLLDTGTNTLSGVATSITSSREYDGIVVDAFYVQYLGRHSETAGLNIWIDQMQTGLNAEAIRASILGSLEYYNLQGGTDVEYITSLYRNFLHRDPDDPGLAFWLPQLDHTSFFLELSSRFVLSTSISSSQESRTDIVTNFYQTYLHRDPDPAGLAVWITNLANGISQPQIISFFVTAQEYLDLNHIT